MGEGGIDTITPPFHRLQSPPPPLPPPPPISITGDPPLLCAATSMIPTWVPAVSIGPGPTVRTILTAVVHGHFFRFFVIRYERRWFL